MYKAVVIVLAVICYVNAIPAPQARSIASAGAGSFNNLPNFPKFPNFPNFPEIMMPQFPPIVFSPLQFPTIKPINPEDITKLKGSPGSYVQGVAQTITSQTEYVNGKPVTKTQGLFIQNDNGKITKKEFGN